MTIFPIPDSKCHFSTVNTAYSAIGYSANGFGKPMEASVEAVDAVDAVEVDGGGLEDPPQGPPDGHRVPVATVLANGAGEMQAFPARGILTG